MKDTSQKTLVRLSTAGSVDDGKSTLLGRLLYNIGAVPDDTLASIGKVPDKIKESLALLTDGLKAEREQGITIDVAYRYFNTEKRRFILADTPGHEQYTRNMATGASLADLTIILVDASKGVLPQTKRHAFIASLMGVPRLLVAVNKMDLVSYSKEVFDSIREEFTAFSAKLGVKDIRFIPVSALQGDNITERSKSIPWYSGESLLEYLENVYVAADLNQVDFRFPVQLTLKHFDNYRGFAGRIASGSVKVGDEILVLPSMQRSRVKALVSGATPLTKLSRTKVVSATVPESISIVLEDEVDVGRGAMLVRPENAPKLQSHFEAMIVWMAQKTGRPNSEYLIQHTTQSARIYIDSIKYRVEIENLARQKSDTLNLNDIARVSFTASRPLPLDPYQKNRTTGNFILVDPIDFTTVAAGMVIERLPEEIRTKETEERNLHVEKSLISREDRYRNAKVKPMAIWFSGLSGSGKSTIAKELEKRLFASEVSTYRLDGDNLRGGLNKDLGFSPSDRTENLRRAAEVAKLMMDAGLITISSFITPMEVDREMIRTIIGRENLLEVYLSTPLEVCEARDPHGMYKRSRAGEIREFTGISSPFEPSTQFDLEIDTGKTSLDDAVSRILGAILGR